MTLHDMLFPVVGIAVAAASGCHHGDPSLPVAFAPALAVVHDDVSDNPDQAIFVSLNGSKFGSPQSGSSLQLVTGTQMRTIASLDPAVKRWTDAEIVISLAAAPDSARACIPAGCAEPAAVQVYDYVHVAVPPPGPPLALASDASGRVFINSEFDQNLKIYEPATNQIRSIQLPQGSGPGIFSDHLFGPDSQTWYSAGGEDVIVDPRGVVWMTQGGWSPIPGPADSFPDHSRIVAWDPATGLFSVYNVPGDRNGVTGVAWDEARHRVWFTETARTSGGFFPLVAQRARIASFDPARIAPDNQSDFVSSALCNQRGSGMTGTCSNVSSRACLRDSDCVFAEQICPPGAADDAACFHEYELPAATPAYFQPAHLAMHPDGSVWFTQYWAGNAVGRLDPASGQFQLFPLAAPEAQSSCNYGGCSCFCAATDPTCVKCDNYCCQLSSLGSGPWFIAPVGSAGFWITEYFNSAIALVVASGAPSCTSLDANGHNPCVVERIVPGVNHALQTIHSLAPDAGNRVWFTQGGGTDQIGDPASVGYLDTDFQMRLFPPLSLYPMTSDGTNCEPAGHFVSFNGAGITVDQGSGAVWFADYCRRRLGRLTRR
jgi:streptogramin lyase